MNNHLDSIESFKLRLKSLTILNDIRAIEEEESLFSNLLNSVFDNQYKNEFNEILSLYNSLGLNMMFNMLKKCISYINPGVPYGLSLLDILKELDGFDVNSYYTIKDNAKLCQDVHSGGWFYVVDGSLAGYPLYMTAKDVKVFSWCLNNGADLSLKTKIIDEFDYAKEDIKVRQYRGSEKDALYYLTYNMNKSFDGLDCNGLVYKMKRKTYIAAYNAVSKANMLATNNITSFDDLLNAMLADNKVVFNNIEKYKGMIETTSYRGKNLLMYAVDKNCLDWAVKLVEGGFVSKDDTNSANQSVLEYAINKKRPYMVKLLMDNQFFSSSDYKNGTNVYFAALYNFPKIAAKLYVHKIFPIDLNSSRHAYFYSSILDTEKYKGYVVKELADYEKNLMTLDLEDLGIKPNVKNKLKI